MIEETSGGTRVVVISGELDAASAPAFKQQLLAAFTHDEPVIVDLSHVTYLDSTAVSALFGARKESGIARGRCAIVCFGEIRRVFDITGLDVVFDVVGSRAEALGRLGAVA